MKRTPSRKQEQQVRNRDEVIKKVFEKNYSPGANFAKVQRALQLLEEALAYPVLDARDFDLPARLKDAGELVAKAGRL